MTAFDQEDVTVLREDLNKAHAKVAQQAEEIALLRLELAAVQELSDVKINWEARAVSAQPELIDVRECTPTPGARVFALGRGGVLAPTLWGKNEDGFWGAWMAYPRIPDSVRDWLRHSWRSPM